MSTTLTASTTAKSAITSFDGTELIRVIQGGAAKKATSLQLGALAAIAYALTGSHVTVTAQAAGTVPITLKGAASQSANLTEWKDSAGTVLSSVSAAGVFSGPRLALSGNGAASTPVLSGTGTWFTGGSATTTKPYLLLEPNGTTSTGWSTSGTGIGVNAASGFAGNLLDLQVAGSSRLALSAAGALTASVTAQTHVFGSSSAGLHLNTTDYEFVAIASSVGALHAGIYGIYLKSDLAISWSSSSTNAKSGIDLYLRRDAANILALRNSTSAQGLRVYNTYPDASNYERGIFDWNVTANALVIGTQAAGTGSNRPIDFVYAGATRMRISTNTFVSTGEIQFGQTTAVPYVIFDPQSAGKFIFKDGAAGATAIMQFGGSSSSFPSLKRSSATLQVRLADDSADAGFKSGNLAATGSQIDFTALPTSDPGVPGRLYRTAGAVMVSV